MKPLDFNHDQTSPAPWNSRNDEETIVNPKAFNGTEPPALVDKMCENLHHERMYAPVTIRYPHNGS